MNSTVLIISEERYDDVGPDDDEGKPEWQYSGFNYWIAVGAQVFEVQVDDNEPGGALVVRPLDALTLKEARQLVDYIVSVMGRDIIEFYDPAGRRYRSIEPQTLEYKTPPKERGMRDL